METPAERVLILQARVAYHRGVLETAHRLQVRALERLAEIQNELEEAVKALDAEGASDAQG